jgi:hypothetical protein
MHAELERWRWTLSRDCRSRSRRWAWLRAAIDRHLFHYETEHCQRCGRRVGVVWACTDDETWRLATGRAGGLRCVRCFDREADDAGRMVFWLAVAPEEYDAALSASPVSGAAVGATREET